MPILGQDTSVLLCSPHRPWEVVRTYHSFSETDYQSIILLFSFWCEGSQEILGFRSGPGDPLANITTIYRTLRGT